MDNYVSYTQAATRTGLATSAVRMREYCNLHCPDAVTDNKVDLNQFITETEDKTITRSFKVGYEN